MALGLRGGDDASSDAVAEELELADAGSSVSFSRDVELNMGFGWPMTGRALAAGLRQTLSVDDTPAAGGDMFSTLRAATGHRRRTRDRPGEARHGRDQRQQGHQPLQRFTAAGVGPFR